MTVSNQLRNAIVASGETHYRIGKETGVNAKSLDWFVSGDRPELRTGTVDKLCEYFGLELCQKKQRTSGKQATKSTRTASKK